jgi:hypothetical protein
MEPAMKSERALRTAGALPPILLAALLAAIASGASTQTAWAAPIVVTPGTPAIHSFYPQLPPPTTGSSDPIATLSRCIVSPTAGQRSILLSSRNWYGYTKPITVYYKMVGGGAGGNGGTQTLPQIGSAGGSTAILKNGTLVAIANGMSAANAGSPPQIVGGTFTVTSADTLQFILGGGGGGSDVGQAYTGTWDSYALPGGGGAGYFGGGAGVYQTSVGTGAAIPLGAATAMGGTGTAGGAGAGGSGGPGYGGGYPGQATGGNGASSGTGYMVALWNGYGVTIYHYSGGGGGYGQPGMPGGNPNSYVALGCPAYPPATNRSGAPLATTFNLDPFSGAAGPYYGYFDGTYNNNCRSGGGPGEIVLQYQAPSCDLIPNWNQP